MTNLIILIGLIGLFARCALAVQNLQSAWPAPVVRINFVIAQAPSLSDQFDYPDWPDWPPTIVEAAAESVAFSTYTD
jgi:hypothetical protein